MYTDLFELCGFERAEIEAQKHRIEKTLATLKLDDEDIKKAEENISNVTIIATIFAVLHFSLYIIFYNPFIFNRFFF